MNTPSKNHNLLQSSVLALTFGLAQIKGEAGASYALKPIVPLTGTATVIHTKGFPSYSYDGLVWQTMVEGQVLRPGVHVKADADSSTIIFVEEQSSLLKLGSSAEWRLAAAGEEAAPAKPAFVRTTPLGFRVRAVRGLAEIKDEVGSWRSIRVNEVIPAGKTVRTASDTTLDLYNRNSALFLRVGPKSSVHLMANSDKSTGPSGSFRLDFGSIQARAQDPKTLALKD